MKRFLYFFIVVLLVITSCSKDEGSGNEVATSNVTAIILNPTAITMATGEYQSISVTTTPTGLENEVSWSSSNKSVATVNDGVVTAVGGGTAVITAYCGNVSTACTITVNFAVYAAGDLYSSTNVCNGMVWKDGKSLYPINSSSSMPLSLSGIAMGGNDVYVSGSIISTSGSSTPYLWDDGEPEPLQVLGGTGAASCCFYSNGDIYSGGFINTGTKNIASVWKDQNIIKLTDGTNSSVVNSVFVNGADIYAVGYTIPSTTGSQKAMLWKNGVQTELSNGTKNAGALSVYVYNNTIYVGGYDGDAAVIWINGSESVMPGIGNGGKVFGVNVSSNGNVYASGYVNNSTYVQYPALWANGSLQQLSNIAGIATCVATNGTDVYAGGFEYTKGMITTAGVWKNGAFNAYSDGTTRAHIYSIMIK